MESSRSNTNSNQLLSANVKLTDRGVSITSTGHKSTDQNEHKKKNSNHKINSILPFKADSDEERWMVQSFRSNKTTSEEPDNDLNIMSERRNKTSMNTKTVSFNNHLLNDTFIKSNDQTNEPVFNVKPLTTSMIKPGSDSGRSHRSPKLAWMESEKFQTSFIIPMILLYIFLHDSWIISNPPDSMNNTMDGVLIFLLAVTFSVLLYYFYYEPSYRTSFYLVLDLATCASIICDLSFVNNKFANPHATAYLGEAIVAKLFARYSRMMRVIKLFSHYSKRVLSLPLSLFHSTQNKIDNDSCDDDLDASLHASDKSFVHNPDSYEPSMESSSGKSFIGKSIRKKTSSNAHVYVISKVSFDLTSRLMERVAMMVAVIACIAPYLVYTTSSAVSVNAYMNSFQLLATSSMPLNITDFQAAANDMYRFYKTEDIHVLNIFMSGPNPALINNSFTSTYPPSRSVIRAANTGYYTLDYIVNGISYDIKVTMDQTYPVQMLSIYSISLALLMILVLFCFTYTLQPLLDTYLVIPLTKMIISLKESANEIMKNVRAMSKHFGNLDGDDDDDDCDSEYYAGSEDDDNDNDKDYNYNSQKSDENNNKIDIFSSTYSNIRSSIYVKNKSQENLYPTPTSTKRPSYLFSGAIRKSRYRSSSDDGEYDEFYSGNNHQDVDMSHKITKVVTKLSKLVQNMLPSGGNIDLDNTQNIDQATKTWLHANYNNNNTSTSRMNVLRRSNSTDIKFERKRLQLLAESQNTVSLDVLNSWNFDVLCYSDTQLCEVITYMFSVHNFFVDFNVPYGSFPSFIMQLCSLYGSENPYHNFKHGCDVCHTTHRYLSITRMDAGQFSKLEVFSVLVAALAHDVGHPGVNNIFLIKAKSELALRHNDQSPLENMHCSLLYEILGKNETNIFAGLLEAEWRESRRIILATILGTDMLHHFEQINKAQAFCEVNGKDIQAFCKGESTHIECLSQDANRLFLLELFLHSADISNPNKPWIICEKWSCLIVDEFARQGDREKAEGLEVSPMMDRDKIVLCNMQLGFIEFVVTPLAIAMINMFPSLFEIGVFMQDNYTNWYNKRKQEILESTTELSKEEEVGKLEDRMTKYNEKLAFVHNYELIESKENIITGTMHVSQTFIVAVKKSKSRTMRRDSVNKNERSNRIGRRRSSAFSRHIRTSQNADDVNVIDRLPSQSNNENITARSSNTNILSEGSSIRVKKGDRRNSVQKNLQ